VRPTFLVIGAQKSGTTSLHAYLAAHPRVFMSEPKELDFFPAERNWGRGVHWYEGHFERAEGHDAVGEASPSYSMDPLFPGVPGRIAAILPECRLVYVMRHPVERTRSHYLHRVWRGYESRPIEEALFAYPPYVDNSRYAHQISRYLEHFPRERLLLITAERLRSDREGAIGSVLEFLGIHDSPAQADLGEEHHRAADKRVPAVFGPRLRRTPLFRAAARIAPRRVKEVYMRRMAHPLDPSMAELPDDLRRRLEDQFAEDARELVPLMDPGFDAWGLG
jgi:hypothetical protein